ncbi:RHS repeat-associated core domain-containing protein [Nocardioides sp.]|uniref:RHS repeat-associated core domain-containing protein n=1 Tax=Nocardioides sp. TaxID=35761 RepID=UPI002C341B25|nr:RHS repeat-associated core domain-containing protein [Nocardioides sp.]HXH80029.1 RHS repeat-associated core domain-containing protein [Nocardioides sp.]
MSRVPSVIYSSTSRVNPIGWTGQYADPSGQVHLRARQYDPTLGRFMAPDQAAAMAYSGTGTYANANPLAYTDPTGLWPS